MGGQLGFATALLLSFWQRLPPQGIPRGRRNYGVSAEQCCFRDEVTGLTVPSDAS